MKKYFLNRINLDLLSISFLIIVIFPLNLAKNNEFNYNFELFISLIITAFILSSILIFFSILILKILTRFKINSIYSYLVAFALLLIFITGNFLPISGLSGQFLNLNLPIRLRFIILIKIIFIIIFFIFLIKKDKNFHFFKFIFIFTLINLVFLSFNIKKDLLTNHENYLSKFGNKNLIVLSFDGISGHKVYNEILDDKKLSQSLKDFKLYNNTISGAPYTSPSIRIELNGQYTKDNSKNILNNKKIDTFVYGTYRVGLSDASKGVIKSQLQNYNNSFKLNLFFQKFGLGSVGRWASPIGIIMIKPLIYNKFYKNFIELVSFNNKNKINPFNFITSRDKVDLYELDTILDNINYDKDLENVIRMYHFTFSHWPIKLNENCKEITFFNDDISSSKYEQIMLKCISKKIIKFLENLKSKNVYNNSMIVIKSDHAKPNCNELHHTKYKISEFFKNRCNQHYSEYPYTERLNNHFYYGFGRYKPLMMIKDENQIQDKIEISEKQVFLHDLSVTYCNFFLEFSNCDISNRNDLNKDENQFTVNNYDVFITKPQFPLSTTDFTKLDKYQIKSNESFLDFLKINKIISAN